MLKLCQDRLCSIVYLSNFLLSTSPPPKKKCGIQLSANAIIISSSKVLFFSQDVNNMYSIEPNALSKIFLNEHIPFPVKM